jgi:RimJ/RimL family protein N-acetyltransferase
MMPNSTAPAGRKQGVRVGVSGGAGGAHAPLARVLHRDYGRRAQKERPRRESAVILDLGTIELRGTEVALRPLESGDAPALAAAAAESRASYVYNPVPDGVADAEAYIEHALRQRAHGERYPFAVLWRDRIVGTTSYYDYQPWRWPKGCELQRRDRPDAVEIGYTWLAASAQRTACNTEAKFLLLEHAFERWQVHGVAIRTDERNERSRRAIERLGCKFEGIRRAHMPGTDCKVRNTAYYSVIAAEWPDVRARLRQLMGGGR